MEAVISSIQDVLKLTVVKYVNTGDRSLDNVLNVFLVAVLVFIFKEMPYWIQTFKIWYLIRKGWKITDKVIYSYYETHRNTFSENFAGFYLSDTSYRKWSNWHGSNISTIQNDDHKIYPTYLVNYDIIYKKLGVKMFLCRNRQVFEKFEKEMDSLDEPLITDDANVKKEMKIYTKMKSDYYFPLYSDRTFDLMVTKHKPMIMNALKDLQFALDGKSLFNGLGSYNLGIILHGEPGTGKTTMIKAICNYMQRNARIIDMRKIKTCDDFEKLFTREENLKNVFVLEEFDCVQGVISRSNGEDQNHMDYKTQKIASLRNDLVQLLSISPTTPAIEKQIENINDELSNINNQLDIYTMLTVLDGLGEHRGRIMIATTNYIDRIDSALLREGRFDYKIHLGKYDDKECHDLLRLMFEGTASKEDFEYLESKKLRENEFTPTNIINLCHRKRSLRKVVDEMLAKE